MLLTEIEDKKNERERVLKECLPPLKLSVSTQELQVPRPQIALIQSLSSFYMQSDICFSFAGTLQTTAK